MTQDFLCSPISLPSPGVHTLALVAVAMLTYEAKLVIVGDSLSGPSTVFEALGGRPKSALAGRPRIQVGQIEINQPPQDIDWLINTWILPGDDTDPAVYRPFFAGAPLYLVVQDQVSIPPSTILPNFLDALDRSPSPPGSVILTCPPTPGTTLSRLRQRYRHFSVDPFPMVYDDPASFETLKKEIISRLINKGKAVPDKWKSARHSLELHDSPVMSVSQLEVLWKNHAVHPADIQSVLDVLYEVGDLLYFRDDEQLGQSLVLDPNWLFSKMALVLRDQQTIESNGLLDHNRLGEIWSDLHTEGHVLGETYNAYLLRVMENFDICYTVRDRQKSLFPRLAPEERPNLNWAPRDQLPEDWHEVTVHCEFDRGIPGFVPMLCLSNDRLIDTHWRRGVLFTHEGQMALIEYSDENVVVLTARGHEPSTLREIVRQSMEQLVETYWREHRCSFFVPCTTVHDDGTVCLGRFKLASVQKAYRSRHWGIHCHECLKKLDVSRLYQGVDFLESRVAVPGGTDHPAGSSAESSKDVLNAVSDRYQAGSSRASWIIGGGLLLVLIVATLLIRDPSEFQKGMIRFFMALSGAFLSFFLVGGIFMKGTLKGYLVGAGGGFVVFLLIQFLFNPF